MTTDELTGKIKIKVTELLKFRKLHFSRSICSFLAWSSKLMVDYDSMGPGLQLVIDRFLNFLLIKRLSYHMTSYFAEFYRTFKGPYFRIA